MTGKRKFWMTLVVELFLFVAYMWGPIFEASAPIVQQALITALVANLGIYVGGNAASKFSPVAKIMADKP